MDSYRNRTPILWFAALAILWGVLAPALASHMTHQPGKTWTEVCLSVGTTLVAAAGGGGGAGESAHAGVHCPFCLSAPDQAALPARAGWQVSATAAVDRIVHHGAPFPPPPSFLRSDHPSRAPPLRA